MQKITGDVSPSWTGVSGWFRALVLACASFACARHPAVAPVTAQTLTPPDGATAAKAPSPAEVALYNETIRPVIYSHRDEVRRCYNVELVKKLELAGRVTIQFRISPSGVVSDSALQASTVGNARLEDCIVRAARKWQFAKPPAGRSLVVQYPFVLTPTPIWVIEGQNGANAAEIGPINEPILAHPSTDTHAVPLKSGIPQSADISLVITGNSFEIQTCYQRALRTSLDANNNAPPLQGSATIEVLIDVAGKVKSVNVDAPSELRALQPCIREAISTWRFPPSSEDYGTQFPVVFQPEHQRVCPLCQDK